jgi:hypothetical protein
MKMIISGSFICLLTLAVWVCPGLAPSSQPRAAPVATEASDKGKVVGFGGPSSVTETIKRENEIKAAIPARVDLLDKYFGFKKWVEETYGFGFGFEYYAL